MLGQIIDSFFSKLTEKLVDHVFDSFADKKNSESTLETLKNNLNLLSQKVFDVQEKIKNAKLSGKKKRKRKVEEWLNDVEIVKNEVCRLESEVQTQGFFGKFFKGDQATQSNAKVDQLNAKAHQLVEERQHFGNVCVTMGEELLTTNLCGKGFEANLNRIWNLLKSNEVSSIGIYGMGGVGKTALVKHINNRILKEEEEKRVCWITVSQVFSIKKLQDEIADFVGLSDLSNEENEEKRAARLNRALSGENITLILDDVWENLCLEKLGDPIRIKDCRLILTTRSFKLCCRMGCQEKVEVQKLHRDEAWDLFKQTLGLDMALAPEVEKIAKSMAKVCDGLPLGIIVLAGSMRDETSIEVWRNELDKLRDPSMVQDDEEDEVFKVLKYSFDKLDSNHKHCFLRCSLYPEDFHIKKKALVDVFISEELVNNGKSRQSQLDKGHSILNQLVKICLLESVGEYWVKMHDLVRAMALKITKRKYMVISESRSLKEILIQGERIKDLEKLCLMCKDIIEIPDGTSMDCPKLTTLILGQHNLKFVSNSFFSRLDNLCFLNLSGSGIEKLPNSLSNLENLKALNLQGCQRLVDIPDLGKLKKLRELDLSETKIEKVPQGIEELANLKFLSLVFAVFLKTLPEGLFLNFPLLQCLHLPYTMRAPVEEIVSLKCLEEFDGRVENVSDFSKLFTYGKRQFLEIFHILVVGEDYERLRNYEWLGDDDLGDDDTFWHDLNQVRVRGCDLKNEDLSVLVQDIGSLTLTKCKGLSNSLLDAFARLSKPSSLKDLEIRDCEEIECLLPFLTANLEYESRFPLLGNLESITLEGLPNFIAFQNIGAAIQPPPPQAIVFSSLSFLWIYGCNRMRKMGLPLSAFQNLETIWIQWCNELEEIIEVQEGEQRVVSVPKLKELHLWNLPRLKSICNTTMSCDSIERIELVKCPELKKLPLYFDPTSPSPPQTLKEILVGTDGTE